MSKKKNLSRSEEVRRRRSVSQRQALKDRPALKPVSPIRLSTKKSFVGTKKRKVKIQRYEATALAPLNPKLRVSEGLYAISMPEIRLEWRAISATLAILLSVTLYLLFTSPYFMVAAPKINGNQYITSEDINSVLALNGKTIFSIVPERLERDLLLTHPGLADVEITLSLPNLARVSVQERQPALIWQQDGKSAWIDTDGIAIPITSRVEGLITVNALGSPPALVMDTSTRSELIPPPFIAPETVAALRTLVSQVPQGTQIVYDPKSGLGWVDSRGWTVQLGDITEEIGLKLRIYETMVNWFTENNIHPVLVNLKYPHTPYYRTEP